MELIEIIDQKAMVDPFGELTRQFSDVMNLQSWRKELRKLEVGIHCEKKSWMGKKEKKHHKVMREFEKMIAVASLLSLSMEDFFKVKKLKIKDILLRDPIEKTFQWVDFPQHLSEEEMKNPIEALYQCFYAYDFGDFIQILRQWSTISLSQYSVENFNSTDFIPDFKEDFTFKSIYKILECCHLLMVRNAQVSAKDKKRWIRSIAKTKVEDAISFIGYFFYFEDLSFWRAFIETLKVGYYDKKPVWHGPNPQMFLFSVQQFKDLITHWESLHLYYQEYSFDFPSKLELNDFCPPEIEDLNAYLSQYPKLLPLNLSEDELLNPIKTINDLFEIRRKEGWIKFIGDCAMDCLGHFNAAETLYSNKVHEDLMALLKAIEGSHLIQVRESKDKL
ncbi:hypothetical protein [Arthrospiribacter ruber]|uniref:Uncharacterized protein n=1 Tax=Arthrospiribacter ruber TaxID=2487934 RepID=A0A951IZJ5_9BACT|nr:hypothetical protein [Arthrospiribacter ruber]MBW3470040.1 hypothetical protein [Arthrospiribacter ruber]